MGRLGRKCETIATMTQLMAVCNVTPDSFSDGGAHEAEPAQRTRSAVDYAKRQVELGASIIDVGGESTRPGAERVPQHEESARVLPVVAELLQAQIEVSVDTMYAETAAACLELGDVIINDVSGGRADPQMLRVVAEHDARYILSHWRGHSVVMNGLANYTDAASEVLAELTEMRDRAIAAGIAAERIILDPGLGFAKDRDDNWAILHHLDRFQALGHPLLIGASRKRFTGALLDPNAAVTDRDLPTAVISALCAERGVWGVRVHNTEASRIALDVVNAWQTAGAQESRA